VVVGRGDPYLETREYIMSDRDKDNFQRGYEDKQVGRYDPPDGSSRFPFSSTESDHKRGDDYQRGRDAAKKDGYK
jgi:hypothetical protein